MTEEGPIYLGVDIGGTKVAAGLVNSTGDVLFKTRVPMTSKGDSAAGLAAVQSAIEGVRQSNPGKPITGIGICSPGPLDPNTGVVINPPNLPCWRNFPLGDEVRKTFHVPVRVDNDANAAGLAETIWGAARGFRNVFYATIGTGIGTGIVFDGTIYHGRTGAAAEGGHITIDYHGERCGCGKRGCIEALASGPAIAIRARRKVSEATRKSTMLDLALGDPSAITTEIVAQAWRAGDELAQEVLEETSEVITIWLGSVIDLLEPDVIVIGGGVGELVSHWFPQISNWLRDWCINQRCAEIPLKLAKYSADAGIAGAAALCLSSTSVSVATK
jgi:glucokinase